MSTRLVVFNDVHIADRAPIGRKEGYREQLLAKLEEIGRICRLSPAEATTTAICTGDLFHSKRPNFVSHYLVGQLQQVLWQYGCDVYLVPGNHDMGAGGLAGLKSQPLSVLDGGPIHMVAPEITDAPRALALPDCVVFWRAYDYDRDADPTYYELDETERLIAEGAGHAVMVAHGSVLAPDEIRPYPHVTIDKINTEGITMFLAGHIHEDMGVTLVNDTWFCNIGSLGRTSRTDHNYQRESIDVLDITINAGLPPAIERIPLVSALPATEVFMDKILEPDEAVPDEIVAFADALSRVHDDEDIPIDALLAGLKLDPTIQKRVLQYLEAAGA